MDRFIGNSIVTASTFILNLKSSMDRFIGFAFTLDDCNSENLKSSMDRFIADAPLNDNGIPKFKIQYG